MKRTHKGNVLFRLSPRCRRLILRADHKGVMVYADYADHNTMQSLVRRRLARRSNGKWVLTSRGMYAHAKLKAKAARALAKISAKYTRSMGGPEGEP